MNSFLYLTLIIIILVILVLLSCSKYKKISPSISSNNNKKEHFDCPKSRYHQKRQIDYKENDSGIIYGEDEDINYKIKVPLVKRREPFYRGWRNFNREQFMLGEVSLDKNFEGTPFRNYLGNLNFFHN